MGTNDRGPASAGPAIEITTSAINYAARGWPVFPLDGKVPFAGTRGFKDATVKPWPGHWPHWANIGIATGTGLVVLDVDYRHGGDESLHELKRHGNLPLTVSAETGSGGEHLYFATDARIRNSAGKLGQGLDIRGEGGYVVAPPSIHPETGRPYTWDNHPDEVQVAPLPDWLERLLVQPQSGKARPASEWRKLAAAGAAEGARNDACARLAGHLFARGVDYFVCLELILGWNQRRNRPPLTDDEVARVVRSIGQRELDRWT
jgi:hypothetical protein